MKPTFTQAERDVAIDALITTGADRGDVYDVVRNEAQLVRCEEPDNDLRLEDLL